MSVLHVSGTLWIKAAADRDQVKCSQAFGSVAVCRGSLWLISSASMFRKTEEMGAGKEEIKDRKGFKQRHELHHQSVIFTNISSVASFVSCLDIPLYRPLK